MEKVRGLYEKNREDKRKIESDEDEERNDFATIDFVCVHSAECGNEERLVLRQDFFFFVVLRLHLHYCLCFYI
jgi:hypothetical protein